jgi:hypothetical protein
MRWTMTMSKNFTASGWIMWGTGKRFQFKEL